MTFMVIDFIPPAARNHAPGRRCEASILNRSDATGWRVDSGCSHPHLGSYECLVRLALCLVPDHPWLPCRRRSAWSDLTWHVRSIVHCRRVAGNGLKSAFSIVSDSRKRWKPATAGLKASNRHMAMFRSGTSTRSLHCSVIDPAAAKIRNTLVEPIPFAHRSPRPCIPDALSGVDSEPWVTVRLVDFPRAHAHMSA